MVKRRTCLALVTLVFACNRQSGEEEDPQPQVPVMCEAARAGSAVHSVTLRGVVAVPPERDAVVAAQVPGRVTKVRVREGDRVEAGALLATIDDPTLAAGVDEARAAESAAKASLDNAEAALARARRLFDKGIAPRRDVDDAVARQAAAAAEHQAAVTRRALAARQQGRARVTSPIAGVVVRVMRRSGELVDGTPATPIVEIADASELELRADTPAADLVRVRPGASGAIRLTALPDVALRGTVVFVSPAVDQTTSLGVVRASIDEPPAGIELKLGLTGELALEVGERAAAVLIPASALRRSADGSQEVVVCSAEAGSSIARVRAVKVGARIGDDAEIASGIEAGERVVTRHVLGLEDGAPLAVGAATTSPGDSP